MKIVINIKLRRKREVFYSPENKRVEIHTRELKAFWKECRTFGFTRISIEVESDGVVCRYTSNDNEYVRIIKNLI